MEDIAYMSIFLPPQEGAVHTYERTVTREYGRESSAISRNQQSVHTRPDEEEFLNVQRLLTATLSMELDGDLSYTARKMEFDFYKPVFSGDTIRCEWTNESVEEQEDHYTVTSSVICTSDGETVMEAHINGLVWKEQEADLT